MDRRRCVAQELRFRKGVYRATEPQHPLAVTQSDIDTHGDENVVFPWQKREDSFRQYRDLVTRKITE